MSVCHLGSTSAISHSTQTLSIGYKKKPILLKVRKRRNMGDLEQVHMKKHKPGPKEQAHRKKKHKPGQKESASLTCWQSMPLIEHSDDAPEDAWMQPEW